ncbi:hypothetical protein Tco_0307722 [Tanacetum coccineum]
MTIETTNPLSNLLDFSSVFRLNDRITTLEKEVVDLKKDPLHTQVTSLVDSHLDIRLGETKKEFMNFLSESLMTRIKEQVKDQPPQILPQEVFNFALLVIEKLIKESRDEVTLAKVSSQPQSTYEAASTLTEFELKKILLDKLEKRGRKDKDKDKDPSAGPDRGLKKRKLSKDAEPTTEPKKKDSMSGSSKGTKSQSKSSGDNEYEPRDETTSRRDWFKKPTPPQEPTDPDWNVGKTTKEDFDELMSTPIDFSGYILNGLKIENLTQEILLGPAFRLLKGTRSNYAELEYDFEECYKALSEKLDWENPEGGDYPFDLSNPGISHWREQCKSFYAFARGMQSRGDVYSTKRILVVTHVSVMKKYRYGYLEEIVVRRADNDLYRFKEGDFPRLWINDIEDMLILVVQNRLTNLSGDDVVDFAIALRMYTRSLVIQRRNRLMRTDELYKFSDGTLTRLLTLLEDITKNIDMTYFPKRRWSNLEKKRAHFMIKDINKLLKERRMMRSLEKFIGGRLYGTTSDCCKE